MLYQVRMISDGGSMNVKTVKAKNEVVLKELLAVMPTLKKHKLDAAVHSTVKTLRSGRKSRAYTLELSRTFQGKELKATSAIAKLSNKVVVMKELKEKIRKEIQDIRKSSLPPVETYTFPQGVEVRKLAEVYLDPGSFLAVFKKKIRLDMTKNKKPNTNDNYIGVEIELASSKDREFICDRLAEADLAKYVTVKGDASIKVDERHRHAHEICILVRQHEFESVINTLCNVLNTQCDVTVNKSCGLHVHVDMRNRAVEKAFANLVSLQHYLYAMLPAERRSSRYSYPIKGKQWRVADERYHGINGQAYQKYKTLEARMHCGTTQAVKINNWVKLLLAICDAPAIDIAPTSVEGLKAAVGLTTELTQYIESRIAKFADQHKNSVPQAEQPGTMPDLDALIGTPPVDETVMEQSEVA